MKPAAQWKDDAGTEDLGFDHDSHVNDTEGSDLNSIPEDLDLHLANSLTGSISDFHETFLDISLAHSDSCEHEQNPSFRDELIDDDGCCASSDANFDFSHPASRQTSLSANNCNASTTLIADGLDTPMDDALSDNYSDLLFTPPRPFQSPTNSQVLDYPGHPQPYSHAHQRPELIMDDDFSDVMSDLLFAPAQSRPASPRIASTSHRLLDFDFEDSDFGSEDDDIGCTVDTLIGENVWDDHVGRIWDDVNTSELLTSPASTASSFSFSSDIGFAH